MTYQDALAELTATHRGQIQADLETARDQYEDSKAYLAAAERHLHMLEGLLTTGATAETSADGGTVAEPVNDNRALTLHEAMRQVLKDSPKGKLRAGEIIAEIERRNLYRMRDGRIPESQQIHARAGHYPHMFGKDGSYFYAK
jgi:hypothetical protein